MAGCGRKKAAGDAAPVSRQFPGPADVPTMIVSQEEKMAWISEHYWDRFLDASGEWACDSVLVNGVPEDQLEESFGVWVSLIENLCPLPQAAKAASFLFDKAEAFDAARPGTNVFEKIRFLTSKYFYDPNSPGRNEDIYLPFVEESKPSRQPQGGDRLAGKALLPQQGGDDGGGFLFQGQKRSKPDPPRHLCGQDPPGFLKPGLSRMYQDDRRAVGP